MKIFYSPKNLINLGIYIPSILYVFLAFFSITKLGFGWDTTVNLAKGEQVFNFLFTLNPGYLVDGAYSSKYFNEVPGLNNGHPPAFSFIAFTIGNLFSKLFGFKFYYFHFANVILTTIFLSFFTKYLLKISKNIYLSILCSLILISIPNFFVYSIVNTKDFPVLVFSFFVFLVLLNVKKTDNFKIFVFSLNLFLVAAFTKFTVIFLLPLFLYLAYKNLPLLNYIKAQKIKILFTSVLFLYANIFYFWPHVLFMPILQINKLIYVYFLLPASSVNYVWFVYFYFIQTPIIYFILITLGIIYSLISKQKIILIWILPSLFYLTFINRQYDILRQFLFLLVPYTLVIFNLLVFIKSKFNKLYIIIFVIIFFYSLYLMFLPPSLKVTFSPFILSTKNNDGWGITLPYSLEYVKNNYKQGSRVYFSPAAFLLEYYDLKNYEIIYDPLYADIFITTTDTSSYIEEFNIRTKNFVKDTNFKLLDNSVEIWVKPELSKY